jgi:hypothetical protein
MEIMAAKSSAQRFSRALTFSGLFPIQCTQAVRMVHGV